MKWDEGFFRAQPSQDEATLTYWEQTFVKYIQDLVIFQKTVSHFSRETEAESMQATPNLNKNKNKTQDQTAKSSSELSTALNNISISSSLRFFWVACKNHSTETGKCSVCTAWLCPHPWFCFSWIQLLSVLKCRPKTFSGNPGAKQLIHSRRAVLGHVMTSACRAAPPSPGE